MIKEITITYKPDESSDDQDDIDLINKIQSQVHVNRYISCIQEIRHEIRAMLKYHELTDKEEQTIEGFKDKLLEIISGLPDS